MHDQELGDLNRKIFNVLQEREIPKDLMSIINKLYDEYKELCGELIKTYTDNGKDAIDNVTRYAESNYIDIEKELKKQYKDSCLLKIEKVIDCLYKVEEQEESKSNSMEEEKIVDSVIDKNHSYRAERITDIVVDKIKDSRNQLLRTLDTLDVPQETENQLNSQEKLQYIHDQISLIERKAKMQLGIQAKEILEYDDEQIANDILVEYEKYKNNKKLREAKENLEKDEEVAVRKFKDQYLVSEEELKPIEHKENSENNRPKQTKSLPGDMIK